MYKLMSLFAGCVLLLGLGSPTLALSPGEIQALGEKGPYEVGFMDDFLIDTSRGVDSGWGGRPIPVYVWYPVDLGAVNGGWPEAVYPLDPFNGDWPETTSSQWEAYGLDGAYQAPDPSLDGPFPLLMFSPGWTAPAWFHISVGARLASHGFVVAIVTHYGDWTVPNEPFDHIAVASLNRPRDVSFALDHVLDWNGSSGHLLGGVIRPDEIAAGGWSLGGYAAMVLAGGDDSVCDKFYEMGEDPPPETCVPSDPDPRVKVIVPLDGSNQVLYFSELARIDIPVMGMGQEWDMLAQNNGPDFVSWQARQHAAFTGHPAYRVDVDQTHHVSFSDLCVGAELMGDLGLWPEGQVAWMLATFCDPYLPSSEMRPLLSKYITGFLKTQLARESGYKPLLTPGWALKKEPLIEFFVTEKKSGKPNKDDWPDLFTYFAHQPGSEQWKAEKNPKKAMEVFHMGQVVP